MMGTIAAKPRAGATLAGLTMLAVLMASAAGCATKPQSDTVTGGAGGTTAGAAAGSASGNAGKGALVGGAVGLTAAGMAGNTSAQPGDKPTEERPAGR